MFVINFSHPLTELQRKQLMELMEQPLTEVRDIPSQFDNNQPFAEQVSERVDAVGLSAGEWQSLPILVNPPAYAPATSTLIAELHGRMGYFPAIIRMRPVAGSIPPQFEVAEIINLQVVREVARIWR